MGLPSDTFFLRDELGTYILNAHHSQLKFMPDRPGFELYRNDLLILRGGTDLEGPTSGVAEQSQNKDGGPSGLVALLCFYNAERKRFTLYVTELDNGWRFGWDDPTRDTFDLASGGHWYGQGELINQGWPLETISLWEAPLMTWDNGPSGLGDIQTPAWITSSGVAILVKRASEKLCVGLNAPPSTILAPTWDLSGQQAPANSRPHRAIPGSTGLLTLSQTDDDGHPAPLGYEILVGQNAPSAFRHLIGRVGKPERTPPEDFLRQPIWTTWARYKMAIDQDKVLAFATEIRDHGFPGGTLEIDDKWQKHYGDTSFDPERFPDPASMVRQLNALGFKVTTWVIPFLHPDSPNAQEGIERGFLVKKPDGSPYPVRWWQGDGYLLDVSNHEAGNWWTEKLKVLRKSIGLAGYKFDAGEGNYLPADATLAYTMSRNEYSMRWVEMNARHFPYCEVRCGWFNQRQPILFRQWDKFSTWGLDNGLHSVITSALALSMSGYPFVLPDMIGGNAYNGVNADKELLIRWTQASAPMLAIQFSIAPWDYDAETVDICRKYAQLHVDLAADRIAAAKQAVATGDPVIRPIFWLAPNDPVAQVVDDEYLLGDKYLVAPVIKQGGVKRDVYLPAGCWRDYWSDRVYGGGWLHDYPASLDALPMFVRE